MFTMDNIQDLEYLSYVIKETMRVDAPIALTTHYHVSKDVTICDVPIPKGTLLYFDVVGGQYDENHWLDPFVFEPERHDPNSEFVERTKEQGVTPNAYSKRAFAHGSRGCPGQSFANLEMRVLAALFISHLDYAVPEEWLNKEGAGFALGTDFDMKFKVQ